MADIDPTISKLIDTNTVSLQNALNQTMARSNDGAAVLVEALRYSANLQGVVAHAKSFQTINTDLLGDVVNARRVANSESPQLPTPVKSA